MGTVVGLQRQFASWPEFWQKVKIRMSAVTAKTCCQIMKEFRCSDPGLYDW